MARCGSALTSTFLRQEHFLETVSLLQCNKLNRGHPTLISQSQVTFTTKESGFGSL